MADPLHDYFEARRGYESTHYEDCWKNHPDCAYWAGRRRGIEQSIEAARVAGISDLGQHSPRFAISEALRSLLPDESGPTEEQR